MIAYVESNFILELAYAQEEHTACDHILALSEQGSFVLAVPGFCLGEPYESWVRRSKDRQALHDRFAREMRELSRSQSYSTIGRESQKISRILIQSGNEEKTRLDGTIMRMIDIASIIPLDRETMRSAIHLQVERSLSPQDAIVYASVLTHMESKLGEEKCFLTKNARDFANPDIIQDLIARNCKLLVHFDHGLTYVQNQIRR